MSRLIDANELGFELKISPNGYLYVTDNDIINAPTIDAEPVVHGYWTCSRIDKVELSYGGYGYIPQLKCSSCGTTVESYIRYDEPIMPGDMDGWHYCQNCGAKMDEVITDENLQ